ncbi:MAG: hypothetical protein LBE13_09825, partial [Bacteroidales bacterium]|nr:hypothetical protein [Bacteroidales bacterium]
MKGKSRTGQNRPPLPLLRWRYDRSNRNEVKISVANSYPTWRFSDTDYFLLRASQFAMTVRGDGLSLSRLHPFTKKRMNNKVIR